MKNLPLARFLIFVFSFLLHVPLLSAGGGLLFQKFPPLHKDYSNLYLVKDGASLGGSLQKTTELLASDFSKKDIYGFQAHAYVDYSLYGSKRAFATLDSASKSILTEEDVLYIKAWVCQNKENEGESALYYEKLITSYPTSIRRLQFDAENYFEFQNRMLSFDDPDEKKQELLEGFQSHLRDNKLSQNDQVLAHLLLRELTDASGNDFSMQDALYIDSLWKICPACLSPAAVMPVLEDADAKKFAATIQEIEKQLSGEAHFLSEVYGLMNSSETTPAGMKKLEAVLTGIIEEEPDPLKKEQLKCLVQGFPLIADNPLMGNKKFLFSDNFKLFLKTTLSSEELNTLIRAQLTKLGEDNSELQMAQLESLPEEMLPAQYGSLLAAEGLIYGLEHASGFWAAISYRERLTFENLNDWNKLYKILRDNPFIEREYETMQEPPSSEAELKKGVDTVQSLINKYPGCVPLHIFKLQLIRIYFNERNLYDTAFMEDYLKGIMNLIALQESLGKVSNTDEPLYHYYYRIKPVESIADYSYYGREEFFRERLQKLSDEKNKELASYLDNQCKEYSYNEKLQEFRKAYSGFLSDEEQD